MADYSPTGYWAHYHTRYKNADGTWGNDWTDSFPVIGVNDSSALVIDHAGAVKTVRALEVDLSEGGGTPDEDGSTFTVSLEVNTYPEG